MLDNISCYDIKYIQKASPMARDAFDFSLIYKFFSDPSEKTQRHKYILRAEVHDDVIAIKFYAARDRKLENKYNRVLNTYNYKGALRIFITCASIIPIIQKDYPNSSFVINGASTIDIHKDKKEDHNTNQRFRIYRALASRIIGDQLFEHYQFTEVSSYLLVRKEEGVNTDDKKERIRDMLINRYDCQDIY